MTGCAFGYCVGVLVKSADEGVSTLTLIISFMIIFSGFFVNKNNIVIFARPLNYLTIYKWGYQVYALNEYDGLILDCSPSCDRFGYPNFEESIGGSALCACGLMLLYYIIAYILFLFVNFLNR